uniref:5-hydroxytryptamine receptor 1-like n=1 Tax=Dermatophagoides pteronyssinus TaxID=6956 RepID=A0A6P6YAR9_DERPT|nr:5-hydroxytryptamine receptor 1-like [Dermatophagoides pteronyssinus]
MMMISSNSMEDYSVSSSSSNIDQNDDPTDDLDDDYHHHLNHQNLQPNDNLILMMKNYTNKQLNHFCNELLSSLVSSTTTAASNKTSEVEIEFCKSYISSSTAESSSDTASSFQFTSEPYYFSQMPNLTKTIINNLLIESKFYVPNNLSSSSSSPLSFEQIQNNPFDDYNHSMMMINNNDYNGNITDLNNNNDGYLNPNLKITLIVLLSLMIVFTVIGNILVCLSVILVRKLRHPSNYLLVSLAISDLCVAILVMPLALQYELSQSWRLSQNICDLWVSFDVTACTSSILNLCTISIDRYLAIKKPLTYGVRRTTRRILSFIVTVWIASCLISIPPVLILGNEHGTPEQPICEVSQNRGYQLYATLGSFYIPLFVMIVMYYKIYVAAKRVVDAELRDQRPSSCTNQTSSLTLKTLAMKQRASNALRERKASVTLGIIMTAFTVCWLPFFILAVLRPFSASVMQIPRYVTSIALWLGYVNSMLNPIIYVTFHQDFRRAFKYLLCFQCRSMGTRLREEAYLSQYGKCNLNQQQQFRQQRNLNFENFEQQQQQQQQRLQQQQQRSCKIIVHDDDDDMFCHYKLAFGGSK